MPAWHSPPFFKGCLVRCFLTTVWTSSSLLHLYPAHPYTRRSHWKPFERRQVLHSHWLQRAPLTPGELLAVFSAFHKREGYKEIPSRTIFSSQSQLRRSLLPAWEKASRVWRCLKQKKLKPPLFQSPFEFLPIFGLHESPHIPHPGQQRPLYQHTSFIHTAILTTLILLRKQGGKFISSTTKLQADN